MKHYTHPDLSDVTISTAMQALADPARVAILQAVVRAQSGEIACNEIPLELSKATVSHHFESLREAGLIETRVVGTKCLSSLRREEFEARFPGLLDLVLQERGRTSLSVC